MSLQISKNVIDQIHAHGQAAYPEEGAGLLLGTADKDDRAVNAILPLSNSREENARHNRYLITAEDMMAGEKEALAMNMDVIGVFHSHPDHPNQPSDFDRELALPWYSYLITSINSGKMADSRAWRLTDDRQQFIEEHINIK